MIIQIIGVGRLGEQIAIDILTYIQPTKLALWDIKDISGHIMDLQDRKAGLGTPTLISNEFLPAADVYIISAGFARQDSAVKDRILFNRNKPIIQEILRKIIIPSKVIIVTNPVQKLAEWAVNNTFHDIYTAEQILDVYRKGDSSRGLKILDRKGYTSAGAAFAVIECLWSLHNDN